MILIFMKYILVCKVIFYTYEFQKKIRIAIYTIDVKIYDTQVSARS